MLAQACAPWGIVAEQVRLIRAWENFVYEVRIDWQPAILRLTHRSHRQHDDLEAELDFVRSLGGAGLPVCLPWRARSGAWVERCGDQFHACCFTHAAGRPLTWKDPEAWNASRFSAWGRMVAALHLHSETYAPAADRPRRHRWDEDDVTVANHLSAGDADIAQRLVAAVDRLRQRATDRHGFGLIHGDLHQGNLFAAPDDGIAVFDFDDASYHWFIYDLAVMFYHLPDVTAEVPGGNRRMVMEAILSGYREVRPLPADFATDIRRFLLLRDMQIYQVIHKKTAAAQRDDRWQQRAAMMAERIRREEPVCEVPAR